MKWIKLSERYPSGIPEYVIRQVGSLDYQVAETTVQTSNGNFAFREHSHYYEIPKEKESNYEWLDESPSYSEENTQRCIDQSKENIRVLNIYDAGYDDGANGVEYPVGDALSILQRLGDLRYIPAEPKSSDDCEEGMMLVQVPVGSFVVPPYLVYRIPGDIIETIETDQKKEKWEGPVGNEIKFNSFDEPYHVPYYRRISLVVSAKLEEQKAAGKEFISSADIDRIISEAIDATPSSKFYTQEEVDRLLAEQHRNTRHDAVEIVNKAFYHANESMEGSRYPHSSNIDRDIMNLKQRKPE